MTLTKNNIKSKIYSSFFYTYNSVLNLGLDVIDERLCK